MITLYGAFKPSLSLVCKKTFLEQVLNTSFQLAINALTFDNPDLFYIDVTKIETASSVEDCIERKRIDSNLMDTTSLEPAYQVLYRLENLLKGDK